MLAVIELTNKKQAFQKNETSHNIRANLQAVFATANQQRRRQKQVANHKRGDS